MPKTPKREPMPPSLLAIACAHCRLLAFAWENDPERQCEDKIEPRPVVMPVSVTQKMIEWINDTLWGKQHPISDLRELDDFDLFALRQAFIQSFYTLSPDQLY
jgi:hypothetical protein